MNNAKKGLRLLSLSIILVMAWGIVNALIPSFVAGDSPIRTYLPLITQSILLVCFVVEFIGLEVAGRDNHNLKTAWKLKIISLALVFVAFILAIVAAANPNNADLRKNVAVFEMIIDILAAVSSVLVLFFVTKGCNDIAPRVHGLAKFTKGSFILLTALIIAMEIITYIILKTGNEEANNPAVICLMVSAILFTITAIVFAVSYVLLILRTTANVGKSRR